MPYLPPVEIQPPAPLPRRHSLADLVEWDGTGDLRWEGGIEYRAALDGAPTVESVDGCDSMSMTAAGTPGTLRDGPTPLIAYRKVSCSTDPRGGLAETELARFERNFPTVAEKALHTALATNHTVTVVAASGAAIPVRDAVAAVEAAWAGDDTPTLHFERRVWPYLPDTFLDGDGPELATAAGNPVVLGRYPHQQIGGAALASGEHLVFATGRVFGYRSEPTQDIGFDRATNTHTVITWRTLLVDSDGPTVAAVHTVGTDIGS